MEPVVTKEMALKAVLCGSCYAPKVGKKIADHSVADLIWGEENKLFEGLDKTIPIWALSRIGYGFGDSSGYRDGSGYSFGDSSGDGSGYGDGYGDGYGCSDGYGAGEGYGSGEGYEKKFKDLEII